MNINDISIQLGIKKIRMKEKNYRKEIMKSRAEINDTENKDTGGPTKSKVGFGNNPISDLKSTYH